MRKKLIILIISIIIPIIGVIGLGAYDYNIYYSTSGTNSSTYISKYNDYLSNNLLEIVGADGYEKQTLDRIDLARQLHSYYYKEEAIYTNDVVYNNNFLFKIKIFKNIVTYSPSADEDETERIRYEVYIYNVDYEALKNTFMDTTIKPFNKNSVTSADYPTLVINFYPNDEYNSDEGLYVSAAGSSYTFTLDTEKIIYGSKINSTLGYAAYDYASNPVYDEDDEVFMVQYLGFNDYTSTVNISDENDTDANNNRARFNNGAYVKIDAILTTSEASYTLKNSLLKDKVDEMTFSLDNIDDKTDYKKGFNGVTTNVNADELLENISSSNEYGASKASKIKTYNQWIFSQYVWWQCLICFVVLGAVMAGFYFTFTYEDSNSKTNFKKPIKKK